MCKNVAFFNPSAGDATCFFNVNNEEPCN